MNVQLNPAQPRPNRVLRRLAKIALFISLVFFLFMFMAAGAGSGQIEAIITLSFGWLQFLKRTTPQISWNWDLVSMGLLCAAMILFLANRFLKWIAGSVGAARGQTWKWPWKWTVCGLMGIAILFLVGMSVGGMAHQIGWIARSPEPWYERKPRYLEDMMRVRELEMEFRVALVDTNGVDAVRQALWNSDGEKRWWARQEQSLLQSCHILFVTTNEGKVDAAIIFPRDLVARSRSGGYYITENDNEPVPAKKLAGLLKEHAAHLVAF